jgi:hypothetical protein
MHDAETYSSGFTGFTATYWENGVWKRTVYPRLPYQQYGGESLASHRAASVHTTPDQYGWRAPTPYDGYHHIEDRPVCNYSFKTVNGQYSFEGKQHVERLPVTLDVDTALLAQLKAEAETLCLAKFSSASVDLSVAFLERKQTANMVMDWCNATTRLLRDLKKGRWVSHYRNSTTKTWRWDKGVPRGWTPKALDQWRSGKPVTAVKNAWLTTRYGIAPSIMDIAGAVEAVENADKGTFDRYIATNRSRRFEAESYRTPEVDTEYFGRYYTFPIKRHDTVFRKHEVQVRLDATIDNSFYLTLQDVGVTNPLLTAWEITPYSFVLDWFIGVGDFLSAINAWNTGYVFKAGSCTTYYDLDQSRYYSVSNRRPVYYYSDMQLEMPYAPRIKKSGFNRTVYGTPPLPQMIMKRDPLNFERMWDSIFLLSNVLGDKKAANKVAGRMRNLRI